MNQDRAPGTAQERLRDLLAKRILILDGAVGTMFQREHLVEEDFRGERFRDHPSSLQGDGDVLSLTRPDLVEKVHRAYLDAGADVITTNTFTATPISQADYGLQDLVYEMNRSSAEIARKAIAGYQDRFVAGSLGPTNVTLSISPKVDDPSYRTITYDQLYAGFILFAAVKIAIWVVGSCVFFAAANAESAAADDDDGGRPVPVEPKLPGWVRELTADSPTAEEPAVTAVAKAERETVGAR